jgi:hypothetical protein
LALPDDKLERLIDGLEKTDHQGTKVEAEIERIVGASFVQEADIGNDLGLCGLLRSVWLFPTA